MDEKADNNNSTPKIQKFIDIEKVFKSKNPSLAKLIPRFIYNYLKRLIHEDSINYVLTKHQDKTGLEFVDATIKEFGLNIKVTGNENIPDIGRYLVVSNHPLGGPDGLVIMNVFGSKWKNLKFPVNDLLLSLPNLKPLFIPINKHGTNSGNVQIIEDTFASDSLIIYYPAGLVSRKQNGIIRDLEWKKTFISKAKKHQRDIIPVFINGSNSNFFYNLANIRKRLNIKANIEMIFLVDEMYKQANKFIELRIGKPISFNILDKSHTDQEWAKLVQDHVYKLMENIDTEFQY